MNRTIQFKPVPLLCVLLTAAAVPPLLGQQPQKPPDKPEIRLPPLLTSKPLKEDAKDDDHRKLLKARYNAAVGELKSLYQDDEWVTYYGEPRLGGQDGFYGPWLRVVRAGLELFETLAEKIDLLTQYIEAAKEVEKIQVLRFEMGRTTSGALQRARFERLDAEIQLLRLKREADKAKGRDGKR